MKISESDWRFIDSFILRMNRHMNEREMREDVLRTIRAVMEYDRASFWLADGAKGYLKDPVFVNFAEEDMYKYKDSMIQYDFNKPQYFYSYSTVFRETDMLSDEERENSRFYTDAYVPLCIHYALNVSLMENGVLVGTMGFYRRKDQGDFSDKDIDRMEILKHHISQKLCQLTFKPEHVINSMAYSLASEYGLTERETEVLNLLIEGNSGTDISDVLCISNNTLKKHTSNIYRKLSISSRQELFRMIHK